MHPSPKQGGFRQHIFEPPFNDQTNHNTSYLWPLITIPGSIMLKEEIPELQGVLKVFTFNLGTCPSQIRGQNKYTCIWEFLHLVKKLGFFFFSFSKFCSILPSSWHVLFANPPYRNCILQLHANHINFIWFQFEYIQYLHDTFSTIKETTLNVIWKFDETMKKACIIIIVSWNKCRPNQFRTSIVKCPPWPLDRRFLMEICSLTRLPSFKAKTPSLCTNYKQSFLMNN